MHTKMSGQELLNAGFTKLANYNSLYVHPHWPGFLFKSVDTIAQALQCGGIYLKTGVATTMYFGLDFAFAEKAGKLGEWARPSKISGVVAEGLSPTFQEYNTGASERLYYTSTVYVDRECAWTENEVSGVFVAIISRADRGFILDLRGSPVYPEVRVTADREPPLATEVQWSDPSAADYGMGKWSKQGSSHTAFGFTVRGVSGYIDNNVAVNARAFIASSKAGFLASMDGADAKVKTAYAAAFDAEAASHAADAQVADPISVFPVEGAAAGVIKFTTGRRTYARCDGLNATGAHVELGVVKRVAVPAPTGGDPWPPTRAFLPAQIASVGAYVMFASERSRSGMPCPFWIATVQGAYASSFGVGPNPLVSPDGPLLAAGPVFQLDAVPYEEAKVNQAEHLPISACLAALGPRVRPDLTDTSAAGFQPRVLDLSTRVTDELTFQTLNGLTTPSGASADAIQASADSTKSSLDATDAVVQLIEPQLTPFSRFIVSTLRRIEKRARS